MILILSLSIIMKKTSRELETWNEVLRRHHRKLTGPRLRVAEKFLTLDDHVSADDLQDRLRREGTPVSKATVYRTLSILEESGLLQSHDFGNGRKLYEKAEGRPHHDHLFCIACGAVIEFHEEKIERLQEVVVARYGFVPVYHSHKIFGYCAKCRSAGKARGGA